jgi:HlyD family secretion protein
MRIMQSTVPAIVLAAAAVLTACSGGGDGSYQGYVEGEFVHVGSGVAGRLERLLVQRGQSVTAGTPLYELESSQEAALVRQATEALTAAEAALADLGTGRRSAEVDVVRSQLAQARAAETFSAAQLTRDTAQFEAGGIARMQLDASRTQHDVDLARVRELESQLEVAELSARPEQIRGQTSQVEAARAAVDQARWRLDQLSPPAPAAGIVVDTLYRQGEWVPAGSPIVRMLPPENVKVRFFVPQAEISRLAVGQAVTIRCDGCAAQVAATVSYVATEPEYTPPVIYSNENRSKLVFMMEAEPGESQGDLLRPGQPVEVILP